MRAFWWGCCLLLAACSSAARPDATVTPDADVPGADVAGADVADAAIADAETGEPDAEPGEADAGMVPEEFEENTTATCTDRLDNDGDSYVDCKDFNCRPVNPCNIPEDSFAACTDGMDNDGDDYVDCVDRNCRNTNPCNLDENTAAACADGFDNDGDRQVDCLDEECAAIPRCVPTESSNPTCSDTADNDGDALADCADPDCAGQSVCNTLEDYDAACSDRADNDGDQTIDCADLDCANAAPCNVTSVRVASWNVQTLGSAGSGENDVARAIVARVSPDVICFQEIEAWEGSRVYAAAAALGYAHVFQSQATTPMAGGLTTACLSRYPFVDSASLSSSVITGDPSTNETGRDFGMVRAEITPGARYLTIYSVHLKSGFEDADYFRRQIEIIRLSQAANAATTSGDAVVIIGDFNEELGESTIGRVFNNRPAGLPSSYSLGGDIGFPVIYDPFSPLTALGMTISDPTHEDSSSRATRIPSGRRIDYLLYLGATLLEDQVYNPCRDDGTDAPPAGNFVSFSGPVVACSAKELASDHRLIFADLQL